MHINNIFSEGELERNSVSKDFLHTAPDGKQYLVSFYNLDLILAIGYRIKGKRAIEFRKWASKTLSDYLIKGYVINEKRVLVSSDNFMKLENEILKLRERVETIENETIIKEKIFFNGEEFDAYEFISSIIARARQSIIIIDPYFDCISLDYLKKIPSSIEKTIYKSSYSVLTNSEINKFIKQYGNIKVVDNNTFHDRFIIIDRKLCYSVGSSLNYAGNKMCGIYRWRTKEIIKSIIDRLN